MQKRKTLIIMAKSYLPSRQDIPMTSANKNTIPAIMRVLYTRQGE